MGDAATPPYQSINQNQHRRLLRRLHHIFKRFILRVCVLDFGIHIRHRFQEAQEQAALHRIIHMVAVRKDSGSDPVAASAAAAHGGRAPAPWPPRCPPRSRARPPADGARQANCPAAWRPFVMVAVRKDRPPATRFPPWWPCASTLGANPCNPMSGKPTVATVPPSFTMRLAAIGSGANRPTAFNQARSFAASTFTTVASIKPAPVSKRTLAAPLTT